MAYELAWQIPNKVLHLNLLDNLSLKTFVEIDGLIHEYLNQCDGSIILIVDASTTRIAPYGIEGIRASQKYLQSHQIERLIVISSNKLNRLAMLLLFNLCRPILQFCDNDDQAQRFINTSMMCSQRTVTS